MEIRKINDDKSPYYYCDLRRVKVISPNGKVVYECNDEPLDRYTKMYKHAVELGYQIQTDSDYGEIFGIGVFLHSLIVKQHSL